MPIRHTKTENNARKRLKNTSFESQVVSWLMHDGWQVFLPLLDHGHKTDLLISDGPNYYRLQVKTVKATGEDHEVLNLWKGSHLDCVIYFARNSNWGYVTPAFPESKRKLNHKEHHRFKQTKNDFLAAFHRL